jgi:hypothetical protein
MSKKVKAFVYNFLGFALFFLPSYYLLKHYGGLSITGYFIPITAFVVATLLAPKFQAVQTRDGEKLFMKWLLRKGVKELK